MIPLLLAHIDSTSAGPRGWAALPFAWELDFPLLVGLALGAILYRRGSRRLRVAPARQGLAARRRLCFWSGWWTLLLALSSPLHPWGRVLFSAHMLQHELLMLVAAPLLVLGRPLGAILAAFHRDDARSLARLALRPALRSAWRACSHPLTAWVVHAFALWLWHLPALFDAALRHEGLHHLQHLSFFGTALLFWWALLHARDAFVPVGAAVLYLFTTMLHSGLLGALLLFADTVLYRGYLATSAEWSLTPLEDQQLGGLLMWVPGGLVYAAVALALLVGWLRGAGRVAVLPALVRASVRASSIIFLLMFGACAPSSPPGVVSGGNPARGKAKAASFGCGACHTIPGLPGATTSVGPPLDALSTRRYLGGVLPNEPENLVRFILDPKKYHPRGAMPKVVEHEQDARDIAAYLYTLR